VELGWCLCCKGNTMGFERRARCSHLLHYIMAARAFPETGSMIDLPFCR